MTVRAIAKKLQVSPTTVSLALRGSPRVSPSLRKKVEEVAQEIGYIPNARVSELMNQVRNSRNSGFHSTIAAISLFPGKEPWAEHSYEYLQKVYEGARKLAEKHGYSLELFWLKAPRMTPGRFRCILEARGIRGLYCLGSLNPDEALPKELNNFAIVGHSTSVTSPIHRVRSYFSQDCLTLLKKLVERGYKNVGFFIKSSGDRRSNFSYTSTYTGFHERIFDKPHLPILRIEGWNEKKFMKWFDTNKPDALIVHHETTVVHAMESALKKRQIEIPTDLGLASLDKLPNLDYTGIIQDHELMGAQGIEMLISRILLRETQVPSRPKVQLVEGIWNEGTTIRR